MPTAAAHRPDRLQSAPTRAAVVLLLALGACATNVPSTPPTAPMAREAAGPYRIRPGDQLDIRFYQTPELNLLALPVRRDGMISVDLLGDVQAAGTTPNELTARLVEGYARELENPRITVIVRMFGGQVYVGGEVARAGNIPFIDGLSALQAVAAAGSFTDNAEPTTVALLRRGEDGQWQGWSLDLSQAIAAADPTQDVVLQPSDVLFVPKSRIANVDLFVKQYVRDMLPVQPVLPAF